MYVRQRPKKQRRGALRKLIILVLVLVALVGIASVLWRQTATAPTTPKTEQSQSLPDEKPQETTPELPVIDLQPTIDAWVKKQSATYSVTVYDVANNQTIGTHLPEKSYFTASLYKLFVAYLALIDFQSGAQNPDEMILSGLTRRVCVDKMIRSSDSPCGEAMMAAMGRKSIDARLKELGIKNTSFTGLTTTTDDMTKLLELIADKDHLNKENTEFLRDAMEKQPQMYRNGLAKGAPSATWFTKVGWNEQQNYHDVGIMRLKNSREYLVTILSQGNGRSVPIADFAKTIYSALAKTE